MSYEREFIGAVSKIEKAAYLLGYGDRVNRSEMVEIRVSPKVLRRLKKHLFDGALCGPHPLDDGIEYPFIWINGVKITSFGAP